MKMQQKLCLPHTNRSTVTHLFCAVVENVLLSELHVSDPCRGRVALFLGGNLLSNEFQSSFLEHTSIGLLSFNTLLLYIIWSTHTVILLYFPFSGWKWRPACWYSGGFGACGQGGCRHFTLHAVSPSNTNGKCLCSLMVCLGGGVPLQYDVIRVYGNNLLF